MKTRKPAPLPVIDLAGAVKVIEENGSKPPVWKTLARVPAASEVNARRVLKAHGRSGGWLFDSLGGKRWVDA